ncbi:MAG: hypothetical protein JXR07_04230 [Reichenbachiella sp.]
MKNFEDDITNFDALENSNLNALNEELQNIRKIDEMMTNIEDINLKPDFTASVVQSALMAKRKKSRFWFFATLLGSSLAIIAVIWFSISLGPTVSSAEYLPNAMNHFGTIMEWLANPKVKQLLIISEAIVLLLIVDKIFSRFRSISVSTH